MGPRHHSHHHAAGWPHPAPTPLTRGVKPAAGAVRALLPPAGGGALLGASLSLLLNSAPAASWPQEPPQLRKSPPWKCDGRRHGDVGLGGSCLQPFLSGLPLSHRGVPALGGLPCLGRMGWRLCAVGLLEVWGEDGGQRRGGLCAPPGTARGKGRGLGGVGPRWERLGTASRAGGFPILSLFL